MKKLILAMFIVFFFLGLQTGMAMQYGGELTDHEMPESGLCESIIEDVETLVYSEDKLVNKIIDVPHE